MSLTTKQHRRCTGTTTSGSSPMPPCSGSCATPTSADASRPRRERWLGLGHAVTGVFSIP